MAASVLMIQNGSWWSTRPDGSSTLYFLVRGLQMNQIDSEVAYGLGLPKAGMEHPFSPGRVAEEPVVVEVINSVNDLAVRVRVDYKPVNYSGLATIVSSYGDSTLEPFDIPLIRPLVDGMEIVDYHRTTRPRVMYQDTRNAGGFDIKHASVIGAVNSGKVYMINIGGTVTVPYKLLGVRAWRDRGNRSFITTIYYTMAPFAGLAANTYGQHYEVPELRAARGYVIQKDYSTGSISAVEEVWTEDDMGVNLPWL